MITRPDLDWEIAIEKAEFHGVLPMLLSAVEMDRREGFPPAELERLRRRFNDYELRTLLLSRELIRLLDLFETAGIPVIPFKGPVLAAVLYGDPAMRRSDDLDLLVHERDFWRASDVLENQGYTRHPPIARRQMAAYSRSECDMSFVHGRSGMRVDLHWAFVPPYHGARNPAKEIWERLGSADLLGRKVPAPSAEDLLLILCLHASKHIWRRLEWICGIAALLRDRCAGNWDSTLRRADGWGCRRMLLLGLRLACDLAGMDPPAQVLPAMQSTPAVEALARKVWSRLFSGVTPGLLELTAFRMRLIERPAGRIRYCASRALLPSYPDLLWIRLPAQLSFLYFLIRPVRLAVTSVKAPFARRRTGPEADAGLSARKQS